MRKVALLMIAVLFLGSVFSAAIADGTAVAYVNGKDADRVHLRAGAGTEYDSLGLYFTGTQVICLSDMNAAWVQVRIGAVTGYMMAQYLSAEAVAPQQPIAAVSDAARDSEISVYAVPLARSELAGTAKYGELLTVLGETSDGWYYVQCGDVSGYVTTDLLRVERTHYGEAIVDGKTSDRVHLRSGAGTDSASLGLYFTGTPVSLMSDPGADWVQIKIGAVTGYMMSQYLTTEAVAPRQPVGTVANVREGDGISIYRIPQERTELAGVALSSERLTVLGETSDGWYYVRSGDVYGYVAAQYLLIGDGR